MNLKKTTMALAIAALTTTPIFAAADVSMSGILRTDLTSSDETSTTDDDSLDIRVSKARVAIKSVEEVNSVKYHAQLEFDYDDELNDGDPTDVRTARIVAVGGFGALVFGKTSSGQFNDTVGMTDVLEHQSDNFWDQVTRSNNAFAYKTPNFGPVYAVVTGVVEDSEAYLENEDVDILGGRIVYKASGLKIGLGMTDLTDVKTRTLFGASYSADAFSVAFGYESVDFETADDDQETLAITATVNVGDVAITPYYEETENIAGVDGDEDDVFGLNVTYSISKKVYTYFETASYDSEDNDKTNLGVVVKF